MVKSLVVDLDNHNVHSNRKFIPSFTQVAAQLLGRQQKIADGKLNASVKNIIGVTIQVNEETMNSVPYLAHLDFIKGIRELTELCDYVCLDLGSEATLAGIQQFYKNPNALEKLLKTANKSRMEELGKAAALEFELASSVPTDYTSSVQRLYRRNCVVSTLRPMLLMIQVNLSVLKSDQRIAFLKIFSTFAKQN